MRLNKFSSAVSGVGHKSLDVPSPRFKDPKTVLVELQEDACSSGGHHYLLKKTIGWSDSLDGSQFIDDWVSLDFLEKKQGGDLTPGVTVEQVVVAIIDYIQTADSNIPSDDNKAAIMCLKQVLTLMAKRTRDRMKRVVIGTHSL
jgi:hypothetical protein